MQYNKTTGKIFEDDPNVRIPQKDLVNQIQKDKMVDEYMRSGGRDPNGRSLDQEIKIGKDMWLAKQKEEKKLIKFALEESPEPIVRNPYLKKAIDDEPLPVGLGNKYKSDIRTANQKKKDAWDERKYNIKQRLKNVRGPSTAELIYKGMTPYEKGSHNAEQRRKKLDNHFDQVDNHYNPRDVAGRPFPKDTFTLPQDHGPRTNKGIIKAFVQPPRKETKGLSEDFVIQKLKEKSIF